MDDCKRCGQRLGWNQGMSVLVGGYKTHLCATCINAWHVYANAVPEMQERNVLDSRRVWLHGRAIAGDAPTLEEIDQLRAAYEVSDAHFFTLGQQWVETPQAAVAEAQEPITHEAPRG